MKLPVIILSIILAIIGLSVTRKRTFDESTMRDYNGLSSFPPHRGSQSYIVMPPSKNLTQIERLHWAENCRQFRLKCKFAEQCCSKRCLKNLKRCTT
ncbi:uncharacterized protein Dana_GF27988 [Drosophila ananassae]|uniref:WAP domain-containing protein n=1 Tax=Drosophila ananassae TaxID=7217 RepID=A0A0P9C8H2_DROAN|nr:uncharacterized protein Dana_GF27988 [Drosophila ananassae]